ncbi:pif-1 [Tomelloso virus]|uniref:Pif-1 n=1 Tax=Tomelloso virus TaxID=2053981 RepID=A0A2H4T2N6_9VIRU|nr:pif-1 [Tomelloso virus]ATY70191.1 pif-1 [Tomelloso virus]
MIRVKIVLSIMASLVFSTLCIIVIICIIVAVVLVAKGKIKELVFEQKDIPNFSVDLQFDPYPQTVNIENQYDCNVNSLRVCDINDSTTLFGCKELIVRCHHFDEDTPYIENNITTMIPKNATATEGYALAITTIADACNPYHGDMTLVTANAESNEYMLICTCKNPGYIGNETILGNCTTVFICNGKINDIDQPLNSITCVCEKKQKNIRYDDGLPVCKDLLVYEANEMYDDWSNIVTWNSYRQTDASRYNVTISGNLKTSRLLDSCRSSLHDTTIEIPNASYNATNAQCIVNEAGYPVVNDLLRFKPSDDQKYGISAILATGEYQRVRFSDNIAGVRKIYGLVVNGVPFWKELANSTIVIQPQDGICIGFQSGIAFNSKTAFVAPLCEGSWPSYSCRYIREKTSRIVGGLAIATGRSCPTAFLWGRDDWTNNEFMVQRSLSYKTDSGFSLSPIKLSVVAGWHTYGVQWSPKSSSENTGVLYFSNVADYNIHVASLTN